MKLALISVTCCNTVLIRENEHSYSSLNEFNSLRILFKVFACSEKMFNILHILHIPNALHEQCLDGMTYALNSDPRMLIGVTWFRHKLKYNVEPTALFKGTHGHPASKLNESIVMHLQTYPPTQCMWTFRHQNYSKILFWHVYISRIPFGCFSYLWKVLWCMQLMLGVYIATMPLNWAYLIEPGLQNCNELLRNSII